MDEIIQLIDSYVSQLEQYNKILVEDQVNLQNNLRALSEAFSGARSGDVQGFIDSAATARDLYSQAGETVYQAKEQLAQLRDGL